jgi:hypothetical protein
MAAFLDNAPTYLLFFKLAGGDPDADGRVLGNAGGVSMGAVFMGALTYIERAELHGRSDRDRARASGSKLLRLPAVGVLDPDPAISAADPASDRTVFR